MNRTDRDGKDELQYECTDEEMSIWQYHKHLS